MARHVRGHAVNSAAAPAVLIKSRLFIAVPNCVSSFEPQNPVHPRERKKEAYPKNEKLATKNERVLKGAQAFLPVKLYIVIQPDIVTFIVSHRGTEARRLTEERMENWVFEIVDCRLFFIPPCKLCVSVPLCEIRGMSAVPFFLLAFGRKLDYAFPFSNRDCFGGCK